MRWPFRFIQVDSPPWLIRNWRRPWGGRGYVLTEAALWRWVESSVDGRISAFVRKGRRNGLTANDYDQLVHFVRRCSLRALRERRASLLTDAFDALALIDADELDVRDAAAGAYVAVCVARELGVPMGQAAGAIARAAPEIAEILVEEAPGTDVVLANLPDLSGDRVVDTPTGPVLMMDFGDDDSPYRPSTDLIGPALRVAQALERKGRLVTDVSLGPSMLPHGDDDTPLTAARRAITGRTSVESISVGVRGFDEVDIDLVEAASPEQASLIAAGANRAASYQQGSLVALIDARDPQRFVPLVADILRTGQ